MSPSYDLGSDNLNTLGADESFAAGQLAASRYASLARNPFVVPFVRTDSSQRVVDSATNWTAGFITQKGVVHPSPALILDGTTGVRPLESSRLTQKLMRSPPVE